MRTSPCRWVLGVLVLAACGKAPTAPTLVEVSYSLVVSNQLVIDSVTTSNGVGGFVTSFGPASPYGQSVQFEIPGIVEAHAHVVALGAGSAKLLAVWNLEGTVHRDSAMASPAAAGELDLSIPRHIVSPDTGD